MANIEINDDQTQIRTIAYFLRELANRFPPLSKSNDQRVHGFGEWASTVVSALLVQAESIVEEFERAKK